MNTLDMILDRCIDDLLRGTTVAECVSRYPQYREELIPLLQAAESLRELPKEEPRRDAVRATLVRVGAAMAEQVEADEAPQAAGSSGGRILPFRISRPVRRLVVGLAAVIVLVILGGASADTVPGDLFYPLKLAKEKVTFGLTTKPGHRAELRLTFADRRLEELVKMADSDGEVDPNLVRRLLKQGALALKDARPLPNDRLQVFLKKLEHFNMYQKTVLEQIAPRVPKSQRPLLERAIDMCGERTRWMSRSKPESVRSSPPPSDSCWGNGCD